MAAKGQAFVSKRVVFDNEVLPAIIIVNDQGKIQDIFTDNVDKELILLQRTNEIEVLDFGSSVLMPGLVDSHVHVNEPGRTHWEGFDTATKAAAAGGVTTIVDMPLNSIPPTTSVANLNTKIQAAYGNVHVDVGFWGGVIPGNMNELKSMVEAGVVGFKCFLCPSGVEEFPHVSIQQAEDALKQLASVNSLLAFHAELEQKILVNDMDPTVYETFLLSRPSNMEVSAVQAVSSLCAELHARCHLVHLSASEALGIVADAKRNGAPLTAETCPHYLTLNAEEISANATQFKCCPPIRKRENKEKLWTALKDRTLDMIVSDHSPCTVDLKKGDFLQAWGGISSLQFGLSLIWTEAQARGLSLNDISRLMSTNPAKLCGLDNSKGCIRQGMDADFVIWKPEEEIIVERKDFLFKNKMSPYEGKRLKGKVVASVLRGDFIYKNSQVCAQKKGRLLVNSTSS